MPREEWHTLLCSRAGCISVCLLASVLILGVRYSVRTEGARAPQLTGEVPRTANPWEQSSRSTAARGQGRTPAEALPFCQQLSLHVGGSVFVVPDLLDDAAPCRPPLTASAAQLAGAVIADYPVPGAPASCPALAAGHLERARVRCDSQGADQVGSCQASRGLLATLRSCCRCRPQNSHRCCRTMLPTGTKSGTSATSSYSCARSWPGTESGWTGKSLPYHVMHRPIVCQQ